MYTSRLKRSVRIRYAFWPMQGGARADTSLRGARRRYHQSEIHVFLKCGKMWEFRYIRGIKAPPRAAMTVGLAVDTAVSANLEQKIRSESDFCLEEALSRYSDDFERRRGETDWREEDPGRQKDIGVRLLHAHHAQVAPLIRPASVQESFAVDTGLGFEFGGTIDYTERDGVIGDTKTSRIPYAQSALRKAIQAALYDFAYESTRGVPAAGFRYDVLIKPSSRPAARGETREVRIQRIEGKMTAEDRSWLFETARQVDRAIQAGIALPAPEGSWYCTPEWCGYWSLCKGGPKS